MMHPLALLLIVGALAAADHGIRVTATCPWNDPNGYTPVVVTVSAPRDAALELTARSVGPTATATVRVAEGRQARQTILVPPSNQDWHSLHQLEWNDAAGARGTTPISGRGHSNTRAHLVDPGQQVQLPALLEALGKLTSTTRSSHGELLARVDPDDLPDRWQGYPDWLVLVLTPAGDARLDEGQRAAIATWVRSGGTLVVATSELKRAWEARGLHVLQDPLTGDGRVLATAITEQSNHGNWVPESAPVPGTETVPVKTFVVLALAFAILVGPLNLWWVRRRNARHLFLITTPVVSFLTCLALIIASLIADGVSVKRSAVQVCYLDHRSQQVVRWTGCTYFAAFSRSHLGLDQQAKIRLLDVDLYDSRGYGYARHRRYGAGPFLHLDWSQGQALSGAVIPARLNRQLSYTEQRPERRRLVVERDGDGYRVANGLGVDVLGFQWRSASGQTWTCERVRNGESATLRDVTADDGAVLRLGTGEEEVIEVGGPLPRGIANRIGRDVDQAFERLRQQPACFTATLAAPMDALPGPESIDAKPPMVVVFGHLALATSGVERAP